MLRISSLDVRPRAQSTRQALRYRTDIAYAARSDKDAARQVCTGMWGSGGSRDPYIEGVCLEACIYNTALIPFQVVFSPSARGQLALIIYEWSDARYIGIDSDGSGIGENQWESEVSSNLHVRDSAIAKTDDANSAYMCATLLPTDPACASRKSWANSS